jgi:hypothetical protein
VQEEVNKEKGIQFIADSMPESRGEFCTVTTGAL